MIFFCQTRDFLGKSCYNENAWTFGGRDIRRRERDERTRSQRYHDACGVRHIPCWVQVFERQYGKAVWKRFEKTLQ